MQPGSRSVIRTRGGADLAFAVVALASYFAMFSALREATLLQIGLILLLGVAYITNGIYGYAASARSTSLARALVYLVVQILIGGAIVYLGRGAGFNALLLLPLAGHAVILLPPRWAYALSFAILLTYLGVARLFSPSFAVVWAGFPTFFAGLIFIIVFTQLAVSEERARQEVERLVLELGAANQRLREYALRVEALAVAEERNRLAREIHDGLGHYLTTVHMQIQAARAVLATHPDQAQEALRTAQEQTKEALVDVRRSVGALRAAPEEILPLPETLGKLLQTVEAAGVRPDLQVLGSLRDLSPQTQFTLYRAAQEALNNLRKHAQAARVWLELDYRDPDRVHLAIWDDGVGAETTEGGFGLLGLRERVLYLNGSLDVRTTPGSGFRLDIQIPG